jgi:hypothetical protein
VYCYDNEYRRQYCRERAAQARDEYRRAQAPPKSQRERVPIIWAAWERIRRQANQRAPAYRS